MEDNKIIEVLECCAKMNCKKCPKPDFFKEFTKGLGCNNAICRQALELIKRQQAEIESLEKRLRHLLQSDFIRSFDELVTGKGNYKRDIKEADKLAKETIESEVLNNG